MGRICLEEMEKPALRFSSRPSGRGPRGLVGTGFFHFSILSKYISLRLRNSVPAAATAASLASEWPAGPHGADRRRTLHAILLCSRPALQPISVDFFFLLNEPSLNGDAKLFFFLGGVASAAVVVVVVAVLSRRRRYLAAKNAMDVSFLPWAPRDGRRPTVSGL